MDRQIAAAVERERPKNTENLWGIVNRKEASRNRQGRLKGIHVAWTKKNTSQTRLEDKYGQKQRHHTPGSGNYGSRTQKQQHVWRDSAETRCYRYV